MKDARCVPLTILRCDSWPKTGAAKVKLCLPVPFRATQARHDGILSKVLVLAHGTHCCAHLARLAQLAPLNVAVVTVIGSAHIERLKTIDGVVREKGTFVEAVARSGLVVLG